MSEMMVGGYVLIVDTGITDDDEYVVRVSGRGTDWHDVEAWGVEK